jgi:hypothetical protein
MNDWSKETADKLKAKQKHQSTQDEQFLELQRLKRPTSNPVWSDVRSAVRTECENLNREMGEQILAFEVAPSSELNVRAEAGKYGLLHAEFNPDAHTLLWNCGDREGHWYLATLGDGRVTFVRGREDAPIKADEIAKVLLDILLGTESA